MSLVCWPILIPKPTRKYFDLRMRLGDFWSLFSQQGPLAKLQVEDIRDPKLSE